MAKNTLTFEEVKPTGSITVGTTASATDKTKWRGDTITLEYGESVTVYDYQAFNHVLVVDTQYEETLETLTPESRFYTNDNDSSATVYLVVEHDKKDVSITYEVAHTPVSAGWDADEETAVDIEVDGNHYWADPSYTDPGNEIQLPKGSTIRLAEADSGGATVLIYITNAGSGEDKFVELKAAGHVAKKNENIWIVGASQYRVAGIKYQITNQITDVEDTALASTTVYAGSDDAVFLKEGDVLTNTTDDEEIVILDRSGKELATIDEDETFTASEACSVVLGSKTSGETLTYEVSPAKEEYVTEYTGASGILTLKRKEGGKLYFYADAGIGYMQVFETKAKEVMYYLNMDGLDSVKIVSETEVSAAKVSEV